MTRTVSRQPGGGDGQGSGGPAPRQIGSPQAAASASFKGEK